MLRVVFYCSGFIPAHTQLKSLPDVEISAIYEQYSICRNTFHKKIPKEEEILPCVESLKLLMNKVESITEEKHMLRPDRLATTNI